MGALRPEVVVALRPEVGLCPLVGVPMAAKFLAQVALAWEEIGVVAVKVELGPKKDRPPHDCHYFKCIKERI